MQGGILRIALECNDNNSNNNSESVLSMAAWTMYCNGRKVGYAVKRRPSKADMDALKAMSSVVVGAGMISGKELGRHDDELMYLRANFERVRGSSDSESFHLIDPEGNIGQELSIFFFRSRNGFFSNSVFRILRRFQSRGKIDGGSKTEEEEKVYSWLYALARSDKDLVFEYVRSTERGLSFTEAERRLKENGPNVPLEYTFPSWWHLLWSAFFHPFNIILIVLSALSYITSDNSNGCIMLVLVFISVSLRFYQEYGSSKAAMKLSEFVRNPVKVQRCAGRVIQTELIVQVDQRDVVPGDIVIVEPGDLFPGDVRLLTSKHLVVSQSSLTGEYWATEKTADVREDRSTPLLELRNICFMGTNVVSGTGTGLVVSTGSKTYISTVFSTIGKHKPPDSFEKGILQISYVLIGVMLLVVTVIILIEYFTFHNLSESTLFGISVACALTPQMLPLIINTSLAKGALAMARERCIVKSLSAIRDMGSMDTLCIDKTGTLTMNHAIMVNHLDSGGSPREKVLRFAFLNSYFKSEQKYPLDDAILAFVYTNGYRFQPSKWRKIDEIPFDFMRRRVSVILETDSNPEGRNSQPLYRFMITKGALEEVMKVCSYVEHVDKGDISSFSAEDHQRILNLVEELSNEGLRVIAVAIKNLQQKQVSEQSMDNEEVVESDMVFLGLITFFDPPKDSAKQALWRLAEKGVKAKVLTGDSLSLAIKICEEVGIRTTHVTTGPALEQLNQDAFHETVKKATVLARLTPSQKLRVVQSLQTAGNNVVGFLGDGINDSLALDAANIGISVDSAASVAKDLADIILLEKDLNVLVAGVEQGRLTFGNAMKYIKLSVIANLGSVLSLLIATVVLRFEPLTPKQLLVQNFLYSVGQIAIPWDKMEEDYVKIPQRWSVKGLLMQTLIYHLIRTEKIPFIMEIASWPVIGSTILVSAVGIAIPFSVIGDVMGFTDLPLSYFGFLVVLFIGYFTVGQVVKRLYIIVYKKWL
ncbi:Cation-transporting P-type ATPase [Corchorus capsularis]|uniref:Magnesium-transporting ATPase, P-type 1 n=1 Tax=Corchorus capsularis TaxID=210143 RepID=A0A1R3GDM4_COCAP|nr:Cation-transporting P-type ATPase [Corchorus capsularis]